MAPTGKPVCAKRPGASPLAPKALKPQSERQTNDRIVTGWRQMAARRTTDQQQTSTTYIYTNAPLVQASVSSGAPFGALAACK